MRRQALAIQVGALDAAITCAASNKTSINKTLGH
jgi:hypothetical protein